MALARGARACGMLALAALLGVSVSASADDNHLFHPAFNGRLAVSDRSTATGMQPWVWMATVGDASAGSILVAKQADASSTDAWTYTFAGGLTSGPDAISWTDGSNARQRVFYSSAGAVQMLDWDNNAQNSFATLPNASTFSIPFGDVASLTWVSGLTRRFAIAGYAAKSGANGYLCFWEKTSTGTTWSTSCTSTAVMSSVNNPLPDIVGVVQGTTPVFFFRNAAGRLARARRTGTAAYTIEELGSESLGPSLFATNSQASGSVDVGVIRSSDNRVRIARLSSSTSTSPTWTTLPALPSSAVPATTANVTLSGASYPISSTSTRTQVAVISSTLRLHTIRTTSNTGTAWDSAWTAAAVPGRGTTPAPEQVVAALGPTLGNPPGNGARLFFVGGGAAGLDYATTLQEYWWGFPRPWRDHVRFTFGNGGVEPAATGATESSGGIGPVYGIATAIQRNNPPPWKIVMASSDDGASSFGAAIQMTGFLDTLGTRSASDPTAVHGGFGGHQLHFAALELSKDANCADTSDVDLITYRRGSTASDIASGADFLVATGSSFDHPGIGVTVDANDQPTAHILYWDLSNPAMTLTKYWTLAPGDVVGGPFTISSLPARPAGVSVGNLQSQVYGWTFAVGAGFPTICRMNGSQSSGLVCGTPSVSPAPLGKDIHFGAQVTDAQNGDCAGFLQGGVTRFYKCFDTEQPVAVYADPTQANRVHLAYQAIDTSTGRLAIFYTRNTDNNLATWTTPVKIASDAAQELINPAITVDYDGTIVVTYSRILAATFATATNGQAEVRVAWSTLDSSTWTSVGQVVEVWDADNLPFHCGRKKLFLGEYRYPDVVAGRAAHMLPTSNGVSNAVLGQRVQWFSRYFNLN